MQFKYQLDEDPKRLLTYFMIYFIHLTSVLLRLKIYLPP